MRIIFRLEEARLAAKILADAMFAEGVVVELVCDPHLEDMSGDDDDGVQVFVLEGFGVQRTVERDVVENPRTRDHAIQRVRELARQRPC